MKLFKQLLYRMQNYKKYFINATKFKQIVTIVKFLSYCHND